MKSKISILIFMIAVCFTFGMNPSYGEIVNGVEGGFLPEIAIENTDVGPLLEPLDGATIINPFGSSSIT